MSVNGYLHDNAMVRKRISDISCIAPKLSPVKPPNLAVKMYFRMRQISKINAISKHKNNVKNSMLQ
jgi:hypothetical protein